MIRLDESFRELFEANDRRTNITNMLPQYGGIHFPRRSGLAVGGSEQNYEFSRNGGVESGCVVSSHHYSIESVIVLVWGSRGKDHHNSQVC